MWYAHAYISTVHVIQLAVKVYTHKGILLHLLVVFRVVLKP